MSYLELAKRAMARGGAEDGSAELDRDDTVLEARQEFVAVRLYSRLLGRELWLARDDETARELSVEFPEIPVMTFAEVPVLAEKPPELLQAILDSKVAFPGAVLIH